MRDGENKIHFSYLHYREPAKEAFVDARTDFDTLNFIIYFYFCDGS